MTLESAMELEPSATLELFPLSDIESGSVRRVDVGGKQIAVVRVDDSVYALEDFCSHADVPFSEEGLVDVADCTIECERHGAVFDLHNGEALTLPATRPVPVYDISVVEGMVVLNT